MTSGISNEVFDCEHKLRIRLLCMHFMTLRVCLIETNSVFRRLGIRILKTVDLAGLEGPLNLLPR